eukprot:gnl/Ergobibamus_cyprinoides/4715.p1 GENE.gnl/Ergobibamus_cyprinoides/4715~~gnl/Ergobibamus_cyprinoides/4715.p1  ORF type:complete len:127 (-),score=16.63 gnl/Ergobibamus_cyprinoides/4715:12-392(-)
MPTASRYLAPHEAGLRDEKGTTALMRAAANGDAAIVSLLVDKEAGMKDSEGRTALMLALCLTVPSGSSATVREKSSQSRCAIVELLAPKEAAIVSSDGETMLMVAISRGFSDCIPPLGSRPELARG